MDQQRKNRILEKLAYLAGNPPQGWVSEGSGSLPQFVARNYLGVGADQARKDANYDEALYKGVATKGPAPRAGYRAGQVGTGENYDLAKYMMRKR